MTPELGAGTGMTLAKPHFIALDTSLIGRLVQDAACGSGHGGQQASRFLRYLLDNNIIPLLTGHHIIEISQHADDGVVDQRLDYLCNMPFVGWLDTVDGQGKIGSIFDVRCAEVELLFRHGVVPADRLIGNVKARLLRFGKGTCFRDVCEPYRHPEFRRQVRSRLDLNRELASLTHARFTGVETMKWSDLLSGTQRSPAEAKAAIGHLACGLAKTLSERGDKRLKSDKGTVAKFTQDLFADISRYTQSDMHPAIQILLDAGIDPSRMSPETCVEDVLYYAIFVKQLRQFARIIGENGNLVTQRVKEEHCPSWMLWREVDRASKSADRASGGDVHDRHLVSLCLYADITVVDKRTHECLTQAIRRRPGLGQMSNVIVKVSSYDRMRKEIDCAIGRS